MKIPQMYVRKTVIPNRCRSEDKEIMSLLVDYYITLTFL